MACRPSYHGNRLVMDCVTCGLGLGTSSCLNSHLHTLASLDAPWKTMRYEEEILVDLDEENSKVFSEYVSVVRQVEQLMLNPNLYGRPEDDRYDARRRLLKEFYESMFQNPLQAAQGLKEYQEPPPDKQSHYEAWRTFQAWVNGILTAYVQTRLYKLCRTDEDLRQTFLGILQLKSMPYSQTFIRTLPPGAKLMEEGEYDLQYGLKARVYEVPGSDTRLYTIQDPLIEGLPKPLATLLNEAVTEELKALKTEVDHTTLFDSKLREFRQAFLDRATLRSIPITPAQALAMGREAAAWSVGLGSPIENLSLDRQYLTDIYIDADNAAIYIEHQKFGLCHTLWQYNHEMLDRAFRNIVTTQGGSRKFDKDNPVVDVMLTRLAMRCHLQRPPATFGDLQAALRIMKEQPFTYSEYLKYKSFTPFFAGYDDVMVGLGCSEAVLGLKGVGKTAFTSAKITAIGLKRRILPIQDIEEIPVRAYRKRGFHIGAVRVSASDRDDPVQSGGVGGTEMDLVSMTNASLRMGDACVIINEIRSRTSIQGVINMLNTQPGIFLLYNLHAQSLKDIQDRLELVFGMPAASMYSTDRYSFLKKVRFGRKSRVYRMLGYQYETDLNTRQFIPVFSLQRGDDLSRTGVKCEFCDLPEANAQELYNADLGSISKRLKLKLVPPALKRRADETGLPVEDYVMEAFYKGKLYDLAYRASLDHNEPDFVELDFVLKCLTMANNILKAHSGQEPDWAAYDKELVAGFAKVLAAELRERDVKAQATGTKRPSPAAGPAAPASPRASPPAPSSPPPAPARAKAPAAGGTAPASPRPTPGPASAKSPAASAPRPKAPKPPPLEPTEVLPSEDERA